MNLSNISVVQKYGIDIQHLMPYADVVFGKQKEIIALGAAYGIKVNIYI